MKKKLSILLSFFTILSLSSQSFIKKHDLDFGELERIKLLGNDQGTWEWHRSSQEARFYLDSLDISKEGKPLSIIYNGDKKTDTPMSFRISKTIVLPELDNHQCGISIHYKSLKMDNAVFKITAFDINEDEVYTDSLLISSKEWAENKICFDLESVRALRLEAYYEGSNETDQQIWLNNLALWIDNTHITELEQLADFMQLPLKEFALDEEQIKPLFSKEKNISSGILHSDGIKNALIIGLGESGHGIAEYDSIFIQLAKDLVEHSNCRLILQELPITNLLLTDLYIQGEVSDTYKNHIEAAYSLANRDYKFYWEFISWLRAFNRGKKDKVHLLGMDVESEGREMWDFTSSIGPYFLALSEEGEEGEYDDYLRYARAGDDVFLYELALEDQELKDRIGEENYAILLFCLKRKLLGIKREHEDEERDRKMFIQTKGLIDIILSGEEKALVFAHNEHIGNISNTGGNGRGFKRNMMGHYLKKEYGEKYYTIATEAGIGTFLQDGENILGIQFVDTLQSPPLYSFVNAAMKTKYNYFFYPTDYLDSSICLTQSIYRNGRFRGQYIFSSPQKRFDAYIFARKSHPHKNVFLDRPLIGRGLSLYEMVKKKITDKLNRK